MNGIPPIRENRPEKSLHSSETSMDQQMTKAELRKNVLAFSGPVVAELLLMSMLSIVNMSMVGHLGAYALSAVGLTNQPVFISLAVFQSFNIGATVLIARFTGAKEHKEAKAVVIQAMMMAVISGVVLAVIGFAFSRQIVLMMGAKEDTVVYASMYMKYMAVGMLFQSIPTAVASILRGAGDSRPPMVYNVVSNIVNIAAGFLLIYGFGVFPEMGLEGAAIATTLAKLVACVMSVYALMDCQLPVSISMKDRFRFDSSIIKRIMNIGISAAGESLAMRIGFLLYTRIIADLGTAAFAAHQICLNITGLGSNIVNGLSTAAGSFTGRSLGANNPELAEEYTKEISRIGMVVSLSMGTLFFFGGYPISRLFTADISVLMLSANTLKIATLITFPQNFLSIHVGSLRGAGDTKWTLVTAIVSMVIARVSLAALFVIVFRWGLQGAWAAALADQCIRSLLIHFRYKSGKWKRIVI